MARKIIAALIASLALSSGVTASPLGKRTWFPDSGVPGILQSCVNPNHLALTWDDGPSSFTTTLLASLKSQGVPASFFVLGPQVELYPSVVKAAFDAGHEILSHGWSHSDQTTLTDAQIISELNRTEAVIVKVIGKSPALFRMPYGEIDSRSASAIRSRGYELVGWNFDSNDWTFTTSAQVVSYVNANLPTASASVPGKVFLIHDITSRSVGAVDPALVQNIITIGKSKGYTFVKLSECLGRSAYKSGSVSSASSVASSTSQATWATATSSFVPTTSVVSSSSIVSSSSVAQSSSIAPPSSTTPTSSIASSSSIPTSSIPSPTLPPTTTAGATKTVTVTASPSPCTAVTKTITVYKKAP